MNHIKTLMMAFQKFEAEATRDRERILTSTLEGGQDTIDLHGHRLIYASGFHC